MRGTTSSTLVAILLIFGCGTGDESVSASAPRADVGPTAAAILSPPFTADEIRSEWVPDLVLFVRRNSPEGTAFERWTVVSADEEGADIEYIETDGSFNPTDEPSVNRSTWVELRDHASFPAEYSTREWVSRSTTLGDFEGWLYRVAKPDSGTVQEFFFVPTLPGAPVQMRILEGDTTVFELEQMLRMRPVSDQ